MRRLLTTFLDSDRAIWRVWLYLWLAWVVLVPVLGSGRLLGLGNGQPGFGNPVLGLVLVASFLAAPIYPFFILMLGSLMNRRRQ